MNETENKRENTESHLIEKDHPLPKNVLTNMNNSTKKMPKINLNKKTEKNKHDNFENLSNIEKIIFFNQQNHHIKDFLFEIQKNQSNSINKLKKESSKENKIKGI